MQSVNLFTCVGKEEVKASMHEVESPSSAHFNLASTIKETDWEHRQCDVAWYGLHWNPVTYKHSRFSTLIQTLACQLSSTFMQLLFSFDQGVRVKKTLIHGNSRFSTVMQTLASQLLYKLSLLNFHQLSCNSCSHLTKTWELRKLWCYLSFLNSYSSSFKFFFIFCYARLIVWAHIYCNPKITGKM